MSKNLRFVFLTLLFLVLGFGIFCAGAQTNTTVATAKLINSFPHVESNVNTSGGGTATGMNGSCNTIPCCSTLVYRIELPLAGSLRIESSNFVPLAQSMIGYTADVENPVDYSQLTYYPEAGNFCGFRDTMLIGRGYDWWGSGLGYYDISQAAPAGTYYVLVFTENQQASLGIGSTTNLTFKYAPACPSGYSCYTTNLTICDEDNYTSPSGKVWTSSGSYTDTLVGAAQGGLDSLMFFDITFAKNTYNQDQISDESLCPGDDTLKHHANTEMVSYAAFEKASEKWIDIDDVSDSINGTNRSVFMWMKMATTVSSSNQVLMAINSSSGGNICNLQIGTNEELGVYDGSNSRYSGVTVTDGAWHHVGYTYDESTDSTHIYVDGVIEYRYKNSQSATASSKISLGQEFDSGLSEGNFYNGEMAEVSIWNEALNASEVALLMNESISIDHPKYSNLKAYYPMIVYCEDDLTVVNDFSNSGFHGIATHDDIQSVTDLEEIPGYNSANQYTVEWKRDGSTIATIDSIHEIPFIDGTYELILSRDYVEITDSWDVNSICSGSNTDIVITEISYNPPESGSDSTEFIEIYNTGSGVIDLTGWQFTSGVVYTFPSMTINSGSYVVVGVDSIALKNVYNYNDAYQWTSGGLSNGGEPIALKDHTGQLIDSLRYDDVSPWPTDPDGAGPSLVLCDPSVANTNGANWSASTTPTPTNLTINGKTVYGSPGAADNGCSSCVPTSSTITPVACASYTSPSGNYTWTTTGSYMDTIPNAEGCDSVITVNLTINPSPVASVMVDSNVSCNGYMDGGATASATGGTMPYIYSWSNSATTASITGIAAGTYTVTITDDNTCTSTSSATITEPIALLAATVVDSNVSCNGYMDGGATASATGGTMPYIYSWSNAATTASITGIAAGTYTVTITDDNGCTSTSSVSITEPAALVAATVVDSNTSCNGYADGGATASASGGTMPYIYIWSNAATTASITGVMAGTYTVTITDDGGCTATASASITEPAAMLVSTVVDSNASCNGYADGGATANVSGGSMPYTYLWSNAATTASITGIMAGTYTVTITDDGGCTATASATITEPAAILASAVVDSNASCNGYADGGATASASGGSMPYTYLWSNAATTASITGVMAGTYTVTITDDSGCTATASATITEPNAIAASIVVDSNVSCNGYMDGGLSAVITQVDTIFNEGFEDYTGSTTLTTTTASLSGLSGWSFETSSTGRLRLQAGSGFYHSGSFAATMDVNPSGSYLDNFLVKQVDMSSYIGSDITLSFWYSNHGDEPHPNDRVWVRGNDTDSWIEVYDWESNSPSNGQWYYAEINVDSALTANSQTVSSTFEIRFGQHDNFPASSTTGSDGLTIDDIILTSNSSSTGSYTFLWNNSATTASISGIAAGTYTVTITESGGCTTTASASVTEPAALVAATVVDSNVSCNGYADGGATASASGGTSPYVYAWSNSATTASITGIVAGTYTVTSTDANGCTASNSVTITEPLVLSVSAIADSNVSCNGLADGGATAAVNGGTTPYNYVWSNSATTASITGIAAGIYTVTSTDANGCSASNSVTITEPAVLSVSAVVDSNASCNGYADGGGTATATGGTMPYNYLWSNGATTATITGVTAGTYTVSVTDDNGCTASNTISITEPSLLEVTTVADSNVTCNGFADGGATATASGGTGSHTYLWSNGATTASITGISGGTYTVTATDDNGCTAINTVTITEPAILSIDDVITNDIMGCYGEATGSIEIIASGGTPAYEYSIDNQVSWQSSNQFNNLPAGDYDIFVRDANDCLTAYGSTISILQPAQVLVWDVDIVHITGCYGDMTGEILIDASGGTGILSYSIDGGNTFFNNNGHFTDLPAGFYDIVIVDENNCDYVAQSPVVVTQPDQLIINDVEVTDITDCYGNNTGALNIAATGGTGSILYSIDGGNTFVDNGGLFENLTGGDYNIFITDDNGCTGEYGSNPVTITQPTQITMSVNSGDVSECAGNNDGFISISAAGGNGGYTYSIDGGASWSSSADFTGLFAGSYEVWTQDNLGCMEEYSGNPVIVSEPDAIMYNEVIVSNLDCYGAGNGEIFIDATGGTGSLMYSINGGATYQSDGNFTDLPVGDYDLFIKDENDCEVAYINNPVVITQPNEIIVSDVEVVNESCSGSLGSITITASGGAGNLMYSIDNGNSYQSGNFFGNVPADTYIVKVKDGEGCEQFYPENPVSVLDLNPSSIVINVSPPTGTICVNETVTLEAIANEAVSYFWEPTGSADQVIYVTSDSPGTIEYTVTVINEDNCESQESVEIYYDECIGIPEINTESMTINIYPNPNKGEFLLEVNGANQDVDIAILDLSGRLIKKDKISDPDSNKTTKQFKLSELENGTYFVRISSNGNVNYKKFVKQ